MHDLIDFFRRNPQVLLLLVISLVLGIGTFIAVIISFVLSPNQSGPGYPSGAITLFHALVTALPR